MTSINFTDAGATLATPSGALQLCSGRGKSFTLKDRPSEFYPTVTPGEIINLAKDPPDVPKDEARWFIPSEYIGHLARKHETQRQDGKFWFLCLDVDENNLSADDVANALAEVCGDCSYLIYATKSATADNRKWRALVQLMRPIHGADYADTAAAFFDLLEDATGGVLIPDRKLTSAGQCIYLPNRGEFYDFRFHKSERLELWPGHPIIERRDGDRVERKKAEAEARAYRERRRAERPSDGDSMVEKFNAAHGIEDLLDRYGYARAGRSNDWRSRYQTSGSYATRVYGDYWISLSGSDAGAGLGIESKTGQRFGDAFDLFAHYEHGGDQAAAVKAYAIEIGEDYASKREKAEAERMADFAEAMGQGSGTDPGQGEQKKKTKFELIRADRLELCEPDYLVAGLIETETLGLIFGDPGSGKSFVALDLGACIATGTPFHGRPVKRGAVVYICGEGKNGIKRRLAAWEAHHGQSLADHPLYVSRVAARFLSPESVKEVVEAIDAEAEAAGGEVALIIVDTLNRNMGGGDENSAKDMTAFISAVDLVKDRYGASATVVHHTGHGNKERARGSMSLLGALDCEYRVEKQGDSGLAFINTKMKEAATPKPLAFELVEVEIGRTRLGEPITSAALTETEADASGGRGGRRLSPSIRLALNTLIEAKRRAGNADALHEGVPREDWRDVFYERTPAEGKRQAFNRAANQLVEQGFLHCHHDVFTLATVPPGYDLP